MPASPAYTRIQVIPHGTHVVELSLNRPSKSNAMDTQLWREVGHFFSAAGNMTACRCIVLTGQGKHFSAGIDLHQTNMFDATDSDSGGDGPDVAVTALTILRTGSAWQEVCIG
jgi:enoyl-CoA hydratase